VASGKSDILLGFDEVDSAEQVADKLIAAAGDFGGLLCP
jgi:hypothetical protein